MDFLDLQHRAQNASVTFHDDGTGRSVHPDAVSPDGVAPRDPAVRRRAPAVARRGRAALGRGGPLAIEDVPRRPNAGLLVGLVVVVLVAAVSAATAFLT